MAAVMPPAMLQAHQQAAWPRSSAWAQQGNRAVCSAAVFPRLAPARRTHRLLLGRRCSWKRAASADGSVNEELEPQQVARVQMPVVRRRLRMEFTCNKCGMRSARLVNPDALARGTVFVQCATTECAVWHKVADALNYWGQEFTNLQAEAEVSGVDTDVSGSDADAS